MVHFAKVSLVLVLNITIKSLRNAPDKNYAIDIGMSTKNTEYRVLVFLVADDVVIGAPIVFLP